MLVSVALQRMPSSRVLPFLKPTINPILMAYQPLTKLAHSWLLQDKALSDDRLETRMYSRFTCLTIVVPLADEHRI